MKGRITTHEPASTSDWGVSFFFYRLGQIPQLKGLLEHLGTELKQPGVGS